MWTSWLMRRTLILIRGANHDPKKINVKADGKMQQCILNATQALIIYTIIWQVFIMFFNLSSHLRSAQLGCQFIRKYNLFLIRERVLNWLARIYTCRKMAHKNIHDFSISVWATVMPTCLGFSSLAILKFLDPLMQESI